ncbi:hypothetical protein KC901_00410 [Patescibacteria group bacterium]|nr:hypothetical protein [Patescibacteria group bacterium]
MAVFSWIVNLILQSAFIWIPILFGIIFWFSYRAYQREKFIKEKLEFALLEINIPKDVFKSPQAMEMAIDVLYYLGGGAMTWQERFWFGAVLYPSSLEIVSIEGSVYFFIRTSTKLAPAVKSAIYSQYPNAEVNEVDDYTKYVPDYNKYHADWSLNGLDYKLSKDVFFPIKTYVDYGLDAAVGKLEEYEKIDPLSTVIEFLGTIGPGEQAWIQYVIQPDAWSTWRTKAEAYIEKLISRTQGGSDDEEDKSFGRQLTSGEKDQIKAIERSLSKHAFECVIRTIYLARNENINKATKGYLKSSLFLPFNSLYLNSIRKNNETSYDWVWEDITGMRYPILKKRFFNDYVARAGFNEPFWKYFNFIWYKRRPQVILTSEELATLFHIPGRVSESSAVERIEAKKSEAPINLPV